MIKFCILFLFTVSFFQDDLQTWTDSSGKFQVDAALISFDGEKVRLRKADGEIIDVEISRLSTASQELLEKAARFEKDCQQKETELVFAENIKSYYEQELEKGYTKSQKAFIRDRIEELEPHAKNNAVLVEGQFLTPDELKKRRIRCDALVDQWEALIAASINNRSDTFKQAQKIIREAQKIEPFTRADFQLGLANVFVTKDFDAAERHFSKCVERARQYKPLYGEQIDRINFSHALGNLALLKIRENRAKDAAKLWIEAQDISGSTPEIAYNVSRVLKANGQGYVDLPKSIIGTFSEWSALHDSPDADRSLGWLYMPYLVRPKNQPEDRRTEISKDDEVYICVGSGTGFIIAPGLLLTNRHVVATDEGNGDLYDHYRLNFTPGTGIESVTGDVIARSKNHDLALVSFNSPALKFDGIPLIGRNVESGEKITIFGYPMPDKFGDEIKYSVGQVIMRSSADQPNEIVTSANTKSGNSGGPIIDEYGNAIGVHAAGGFKSHAKGLNQMVTFGEPGVAALEFVRKYRSDFVSKPLVKSRMPEKLVEDYESLVVRIEIFYAANRLGQLAAEIAQKNNESNRDNRATYTGLADKTCFKCSGRGTVNCPIRLCKKGKITKQKTVLEQVPNSKFVQKRIVRYYEKCPTCRGAGKVRCRACGGDGEE